MTLQIYNNLKGVVTRLVDTLHLTREKQNPKGRKPAIPLVEGITLALYARASGRVTKKSVYDDFEKELSCTYKTFVVTINVCASYALLILYALMRTGRKNAHGIKLTDATDLPVCLAKNAKKHKTMNGLACWGHSGKGFYYGLKMTMTRDLEGRILAIRFTCASANDREIFMDININMNGLFIADNGYCSKELERIFHQEGKRMILTKPRKNMRRIATATELALYNLRFRIEYDFRSLKQFYGMVTSMPRSVNGYFAHYISSILAYMIA